MAKKLTDGRKHPATKAEMALRRQRDLNKKLVEQLLDKLEVLVKAGDLTASLHYKSRLTKIQEENEKLERRISKIQGQPEEEGWEGGEIQRDPFPSVLSVGSFEELEEKTKQVEEKLGMSKEVWYAEHFKPGPPLDEKKMMLFGEDMQREWEREQRRETGQATEQPTAEESHSKEVERVRQIVIGKMKQGEVGKAAKPRRKLEL